MSGSHELAEAIFINESGHARREVVEYSVKRGKGIQFFLYAKGRGVEGEPEELDLPDLTGCRTNEATIAVTDADVRAWLEAHAKAGDITEGERRDALEFMDEFI